MDKYELARDALIKNISVFEGAYLDKKKANQAVRDIKRAAREAYALRDTSRLLNLGVKRYFTAERRNKREIKRFLKKSRKRLLRKEKGKFAAYEIKPARITDVRQARGDMAEILRDCLKRITQ